MAETLFNKGEKMNEVLDALEKAYNEDTTSDIKLLDVVKETINYLKGVKNDT